MYNTPRTFQCPYYANTPMYNPVNMYPVHKKYQCPYYTDMPKFSSPIVLKDYGPNPFVVDIEEATRQNNNFRIALWTGKHLQLTLMSINVGEDIGLELHPNLDQFIRIEEGQGIVLMGDKEDKLDFRARVWDDYAIVIPAGKWHNVINTGNRPVKLYSIYAPPQHPHSTVHETREDAEENHGR